MKDTNQDQTIQICNWKTVTKMTRNRGHLQDSDLPSDRVLNSRGSETPNRRHPAPYILATNSEPMQKNSEQDNNKTYIN